MKTLKDFSGLYQLSKTLRFELKPIGKTLEYIEKNKLLEQDQHRSDSYSKVKKIIDNYHKAYIERVLSDFSLKIENNGKKDSLTEFYFYYMLNIKDETRSENLSKIQDNLRKQVAVQLTKDEKFKNIDKKELIKEDLLKFVKTTEEKKLVEEFKNFTTYFTGFHENRKNMYSSEEKSTAISYRLINENLPKFVDNMRIFDKVAATSIAEQFNTIYSNFKDILKIYSIDEMFKLEYYSRVLTQSAIDTYNTIVGGMSTGNGEKIKGLNEYINLYNQQQKDKNLKLPKLKPLFKQILSDRNSLSWLPEEFTDDNDLLVNIEKCYKSLTNNVFESTDKHKSIKNL